MFSHLGVTVRLQACIFICLPLRGCQPSINGAISVGVIIRHYHFQHFSSAEKSPPLQSNSVCFMLPRKKSKPNPKAETEAGTQESTASQAQGQEPQKQELPQSSLDQGLPPDDPESAKTIKGGYDGASTVSRRTHEGRRNILTSASLNQSNRGTVVPGPVETKPILSPR